VEAPTWKVHPTTHPGDDVAGGPFADTEARARPGSPRSCSWRSARSSQGRRSSLTEASGREGPHTSRQRCSCRRRRPGDRHQPCRISQSHAGPSPVANTSGRRRRGLRFHGPHLWTFRHIICTQLDIVRRRRGCELPAGMLGAGGAASCPLACWAPAGLRVARWHVGRRRDCPSCGIAERRGPVYGSS
jgi:hypothetical protein